MNLRLVIDNALPVDTPSTARAPDTPDYARMLAAIAAGDRRAESRLIETISPPLRVVLRRRAPAHADIDDLQQETLMVVLAAAREGRINDPQALVGFTIETASLLALNAARKAQRQRTGSDDDAIQNTLGDEVGNDEAIDREARRTGVYAVLAALPNPRDRQVLFSYYLDEEPSAVLQARLSMDSTQLGRVLHRARKRFGDAWRRMRMGSDDDD